MARGGSFLIGAVVLALIAAGVLVGTDLVKLPPSLSPFSPSPSTQSSPETRLMTALNEAAAGGGFAATFAENEVNKWQVTEGHRLERFSLNEPQIVMARLASDVPRRDDMLLQGLSIELPVEFAQRVNGKRIMVGILARMPQTNGASEVSMVYATRQSGNSGWKPLPLDTQFGLRSFLFDVPQLTEGYTNRPVVVIHADTSGQGRAVEILGIYVKQVDK